MTEKMDPFAAAPALMQQWKAVADAAEQGLDKTVVELVKIRASQINGCANCINMHSIDARAYGESEQRLYLLAAWREAPVFTPRERAALAWTDALTRLSQGHTQGAAKADLDAHFSAQEQVTLTMLINIINGWNRLVAAFDLWYDMPAAKAA